MGALRAQIVWDGGITFWWRMVTFSKGRTSTVGNFPTRFARSHQTKPKALLRKRDSGAERSVTFWGVAVGGGAEKTPNLDFMKSYPCKGGCGTTIISHTLR